MSLHIKLESLQSVLSGAASVCLRDSPEFSSVALRWSEFAAPQPGAIVNVQTEEDVQRTVSQKIQFSLSKLLIVLRFNGHLKMELSLWLRMDPMAGRSTGTFLSRMSLSTCEE